MWRKHYMISLFNEYRNAGKISDALLIGRNLFNQNPGDLSVFLAYYEQLCSLAEHLPLLEERQAFAQQASVALSFFCENALLTKELISQIGIYQDRINCIQSDIEAVISAQETKHQEDVEAQNNQCLAELYPIKSSIQSATTQEMLDSALKALGVLDNMIQEEYLTDKQQSDYESLTKEFTDSISAKMRELEFKKNIAYNKKAAESFAKAFKQFQTNESKYKNQNLLFELASKTLFAYDAARLFNETLIYYNHIYAYIFSKLDDDGKLALTRYSIECERNSR